MTDAHALKSLYEADTFNRRLRKRRRSESRMRWFGLAAILIAVGMLTILLGSIIVQGHTAFMQTNIRLEITFDPELISMEDRDGEQRAAGNFGALVDRALEQRFQEHESREARQALSTLISTNARFELRDAVNENPDLIGQTKTVWVPASDDVDIVWKGVLSRDLPEDERPVSDQQLAWMDALAETGDLETRFNTDLFVNSASRSPATAGLLGAIVGSMLMLIVTAGLSVPIAVGAALYLEAFAPRNKWTDLIEVNINNLAAVPSIIFGLLGLAIFINLFGITRSTPVAGGMALALLALPTMIIAGRSAIRAVPPSFQEGALMLGASKMQAIRYHVLPNALPGILTGVILGMAEALGETAPLLMIGMVAFVAGVPGGFTEPASALPVQIYLWSTSPARGFVEKTAAAIIVLLVFLVLMNALAIYLRHHFHRRW